MPLPTHTSCVLDPSYAFHTAVWKVWNKVKGEEWRCLFKSTPSVHSINIYPAVLCVQTIGNPPGDFSCLQVAKELAPPWTMVLSLALRSLDSGDWRRKPLLSIIPAAKRKHGRPRPPGLSLICQNFLHHYGLEYVCRDGSITDKQEYWPCFLALSEEVYIIMVADEWMAPLLLPMIHTTAYTVAARPAAVIL